MKNSIFTKIEASLECNFDIRISTWTLRSASVRSSSGAVPKVGYVTSATDGSIFGQSHVYCNCADEHDKFESKPYLRKKFRVLNVPMMKV